MLAPARITQLLVEVVFVLLGALVIFLGSNGRIYFDSRGIPWMVLSIALIAWGILALARPGLWWANLQKWNRGGSLVLLGIVMLTLSRAPFLWVPRLLILGGVILMIRGTIGCALILRQG